MQSNSCEVRLIDANKFKRMLQNLRRHLIHFGAFGKAAFVSHIIKWLDGQPTIHVDNVETEENVTKLASLLSHVDLYVNNTSFETQALFLIENGVTFKKEN